MKVRISNFKSVGEAEFDIAPLTIFLGPPAAGKSNIMDGLALIGYFNRIFLLSKEYSNSWGNLEPLTMVTRINEPRDLFRYGSPTQNVFIELRQENKKLSLKLGYEKGALKVKLNDVELPWDLRPTPSAAQVNNIVAVLSRVFPSSAEPLESRLYSFDRYSLSTSNCNNILSCGFQFRLKGQYARNVPINILSELGWNAINLTRKSRLIHKLNMAIKENLDEYIEVKVLNDGKIVIFDYDKEVSATSVSDTIFRTLYYALTLETARDYAKIHGLENNMIVLLEEPEAHLFPFMLDFLNDEIREALQTTKVVLSTHNPIFVSMLWDKIKDVKTYYAYREEERGTKVKEIAIERMASEYTTTEEILMMSPRKVVEKYTKSSAKRGHPEARA